MWAELKAEYFLSIERLVFFTRIFLILYPKRGLNIIILNNLIDANWSTNIMNLTNRSEA